MTVQNHLTAIRLDDSTKATLKDLASYFSFNQSQVMRKSLRLLKELTEIKKQCGELRINTTKGERVLILLS